MIYLVSLSVSALLLLFISVFLYKSKYPTQIKYTFLFTLICLLIGCVGLIAQILFSEKFNIPSIYFDYFVYIGNCFLPVCLFLFSIAFSSTKFKFTRKYLLLFIIPVISLILLWTNNSHHLFYVTYSTDFSKTVYGPYLNLVHTPYTYILCALCIFNLLKYSIKNSGLFSKQAILITIGTLFPIVINVLGMLNIIEMAIYTVPITFAVSGICIAFAIFKFDFLKIAPIALQKIVDRMSDGYMIIDEKNSITDFNKTFLDLFSLKAESIRGIPLKTLLQKLTQTSEYNSDFKDFFDAIASTRNDNHTYRLEKFFSHLNKYFNIEISSIRNDNAYLGTLILLKDVTQHKKDMDTIESNQKILIERERLASLGQMIGGIAHNLKTPIMSISGAAEGLTDLINEYSTSIGDPEVTKEDHLEIANDMRNWISKIQTHLSYMSDVITTVKGQAVTFSDSTSFTDFTIADLIRQIGILMKHELNHALVTLEEDIRIDKTTSIKGNINSLIQVINNMISNAIQAYQGKTGQKIILSIYENSNNRLMIKIQDFAGGLPATVKDKLFKEMITTKGKSGTGLGLFMSYSNIKAHFNGDITFSSINGVGTTFTIEIPN